MTYYLHKRHAYSKAGASENTCSYSSPAHVAHRTPETDLLGFPISDREGYGYGNQAGIWMAAPAVGSTSKREVRRKLPKLAMLACGKGNLAHPGSGDGEAFLMKKASHQENCHMPEPPVLKYEPKHALLSPLQSSRMTENLRFDHQTPLLKLLDVHQLDTGHDWRFVDPKEWLEVKYAIGKQDSKQSSTDKHTIQIDPDILTNRERCAKIWYNLTGCVLLGTRQAYEAGSYPMPKPRQDTIVGSPRYRFVNIVSAAKALNMKFLCTAAVRHQLPKPAVSFGIPNSPPLVCCPLSPLEALVAVERLCHAEHLPGTKIPPLILAIDGEMCTLEGNMLGKNTKGRPAAHGARPLMTEQPTLKELFLRTNAQAFIAEAERRLAIADSAHLSAHLTAMEDPYVLYCNDIGLLREGAPTGYSFNEHPLSFDAILYTMSPAQPITSAIRACDTPDALEEKVDHALWYGKNKELGINEEYVMKEDEQAFYQRLTLVAESAIGESQPPLEQTSHNPLARRNSKERAKELAKIKPVLPILVLALPGNSRHPLGGVSRLLHGLRERFAEQFCAIILACGTDDGLCKQIDSTINNDFYELDDLPGVIEEANWSPLLKKLLAQKSVSTRWKKKPKQPGPVMGEQRKDSKLRKLPSGLTVPKPKLSRTATGLPGTQGGAPDLTTSEEISPTAAVESKTLFIPPPTPVAFKGKISRGFDSKEEPKTPQTPRTPLSPSKRQSTKHLGLGQPHSPGRAQSSAISGSEPETEPSSPKGQVGLMNQQLQIMMELKEQKMEQKTQCAEKKRRTQAWAEMKLTKDVQRLAESLSLGGVKKSHA